MRFVEAESRLEPVEFLTDVKHWRETDLCGVTALAAITGHAIEYVTHTILKARGCESPIRGMQVGEVVNTLGLLGFRADVFEVVANPGHRVTLQHFWKTRGDECGACIAHTHGHYLAIDCFGVIDTCTTGQLGDPTTHPYKFYTVKGYIEVRKMP